MKCQAYALHLRSGKKMRNTNDKSNTSTSTNTKKMMNNVHAYTLFLSCLVLSCLAMHTFVCIADDVRTDVRSMR